MAQASLRTWEPALRMPRGNSKRRIRLLTARDNNYHYDQNGNLFKTIADGNSIEYQYNIANRLSAVYFEDGTELQYLYDGRKLLLDIQRVVQKLLQTQ